ncbi:amino acid ABC transporter permease [Cypionkella sp.]|uniref:amino acid ABC transporter permease n=1 Tax=Cypionkella sp. TaxID=2811411 RepID=UPI002FDDE81E
MTQSSMSFVRDKMLTQQKPPASEVGAVRWVRENLFSSPLNGFLTLISLYVVYWIIASSLPWFLNGVWTANSLGECRQIIEANAGPGAEGACWAILRERWHQFLFGFYPMDAYWRPVLAFGLMLMALAPALYYGLRRVNMLMLGTVSVLTLLGMLGVGTDGFHLLLSVVVFAALFAVAALMPKKLLWLTLVYPLVGFYLLWGGSVWGPVGVAIGFGLLVVVWNKLQSRLGAVVAGGIAVAVALIWWLQVQPMVTTPLAHMMPIRLMSVDSDQFGGFLLSFVIGVTAVSASLPMGLLLALGRRSDMVFIKSVSVVFIEFIRGVPLITMLFTASLLLNYFLPPRSNFDLILRVIILVTFFAAAYIAEVIRGGLAALPKGQSEAADALGLDYWQAQRFIILPQALKISIPGIVSSFIGLFKDTTLVALVGLADPLQGITKMVRADINWKGVYWEPLLFVGVIFFIFCFGMSRYSMYLERKLKTDHR